MSVKYDFNHISRFFDEYGEREWTRLDADAEGRVSFHLHRRFLERYVKAGDEILEVGAGAGRFTIELAKIGARLTIGDASRVQMELNETKVLEAGLESAVVERKLLDIVDLGAFASESFDAVVAYGGPLSYVMERADEALGELLRVTKKGGHLLLSVMSLVGATRKFFPGVVKWAKERSLDEVVRIIETGDQTGDISAGHHCHMYRWSELKALLERHACRIVEASASNYLSVNHQEVFQQLIDDPPMLELFLRWEEEFCREPGAIDGGTHIIAVVTRT
ncbi:MAG TPA: class I SAM-dependent methyltransferase [Pyrinomonadaceae bacterium]|jgi:ubiquinone/menaquinone biosynthesis C-methylase UbiE